MTTPPTSPLGDINQCLAAAETAARRARNLLTGRFAVKIAGFLITTGSTASLIEQGAPWWSTSTGMVLAAVWARAAHQDWARRTDATELLENIAHARHTGAKIGEFIEFLRERVGVHVDPTPDTPERAT